jgi:glycosyltransferase involved in cell wall biosynthesis
MANPTTTRLNIGLFYQNDEAWIGGTYYMLNLVQALHRLSPNQQPIITVLSNKIADFEQLKKLTNYPYLMYCNTETRLSLWQRGINRALRPILRRNVFENRPKLDVVFPIKGQKYLYFTELVRQRVCWIPDFQEEFLPELFDAAELADRRFSHKHTAQNMPHLLLSSISAEQHFQQFYGKIAKCQVHILPFAVTHDLNYKMLDIKDLCQKYNIPTNYYFAPNQFWKHKNHWLILRAMAKLKAEGSEVVMVFSGKEADYRHPNHVAELKAFVIEQGLQNQVYFLGFIDRQDQLALMLHAKSVVQASLFEGWSTVVEDAKAMNQSMIVSDLDVHREQLTLSQEAIFFAPDDADQLAALLQNRWLQATPYISRDYNENIRLFGEHFMRIIRAVLK